MSFFRRMLDAITYPLRAMFYSPSKLFAPLRRLAKLSMPSKVSILAFVFLTLFAVTWLVVSYCYATEYPAGLDLWKRSWWKIAALVVVIPIVLYYTLKFWQQGEISPYPDIERAWKTGLAELQRQGMDLSRTPLFLILGSAGESQERALFHASQIPLNMEEIPHGRAPLHWYANSDGIYLVCTDAGCLSKLASVAGQVADTEHVREAPGPSPPRARQKPVHRTIVADAGASEPEFEEPPEVRPAPAQTSDIRGTMQIGGGTASPGEASVAGVVDTQRRVIKLDPHDLAEQTQRLQYLCGLIRRQRQPLCPINGILTLLSFDLIQRSPAQKGALQDAVQRDLSTVVRVLMLRCPVTALVVGMEKESGFQELVRRLGRDSATNERFGKGYSTSNPPLPERLRALAAHACGAFEDFVYAMFRKKDALSQTTNTRLYSLLVKVRRDVRGRLADILAHGFAAEGRPDQPSDGLLFGGCYFVGTGDDEDRQAFVRSVFDKLPQQQEEVRWTRAAIRHNEKLLGIANGFFVLCFALIALLVAAGIHQVLDR